MNLSQDEGHDSQPKIIWPTEPCKIKDNIFLSCDRYIVVDLKIDKIRPNIHSTKEIYVYGTGEDSFLNEFPVELHFYCDDRLKLVELFKRLWPGKWYRAVGIYTWFDDAPEVMCIYVDCLLQHPITYQETEQDI
jgi:hypothetical protein